MRKECETCAHADLAEGVRRVIKNGSVTIIQDGRINTVCKHTGTKSINYDGGEMQCSAWKRKKD